MLYGNFIKTAVLFSKITVPFAFLSTMCEISRRSISSLTPGNASLLKFSHSSREGNGDHSSTLAWKIPWPEEPGRMQSMGSQRVRYD